MTIAVSKPTLTQLFVCLTGAILFACIACFMLYWVNWSSPSSGSVFSWGVLVWIARNLVCVALAVVFGLLSVAGIWGFFRGIKALRSGYNNSAHL